MVKHFKHYVKFCLPHLKKDITEPGKCNKETTKGLEHLPCKRKVQEFGGEIKVTKELSVRHVKRCMI